MNQKIVSERKALIALREEHVGALVWLQQAKERNASLCAEIAQKRAELKECNIEKFLDPQVSSSIPPLEKSIAELAKNVEESDSEIQAASRKIQKLDTLIAEGEGRERQSMKDVLSAAITGIRDRYCKAAEEYAAAFEELSVGVGEMAQLGGLGQLKERHPELIGFPAPVHGNEAGINAPSVLLLEKAHDGYRRRFPFVMSKARRLEIVNELLK